MKHKSYKKYAIILGLLPLLIFGSCNREVLEEITPENYLLIVNTLSETISIYDLERDTLKEDVLQTGKTPNDLLILGDLGLVVNSGFQGVAALDVIDLKEMKLIKRAPLPLGSNPYAITTSGDKFYITLAAKDQVLVLDKNFIPQDSFRVGRWPEGIVYYDGTIYVACSGFNTQDFSYGDGYLYTIDTRSQPYRIDSVKVGKNPQMVKIYSGKVYIMCTGDYISENGSFYVYDPAEKLLVDSVRISFNPQDFVYYQGKYFFTDFSRGVFATSDGNCMDTVIVIFGASRIILDNGNIWASIFSSNDQNYVIQILPDSNEILWIEAGQAKGVGPIGIYRKYN
ncbi:MAG: YncE family protein [Candidatus Hydrothermia bacterium]